MYIYQQTYCLVDFVPVWVMLDLGGSEMSDVLEKWGQPVAERGFAQIPNYLLLLNQFLDAERRLSSVEILILIQLVGTWWRKKEMPFPSMVTLATRCGVSDRQIQRAINSLEKKAFITKTKRRAENGLRATNAYDLQPLIVLLNQVARAFPNEFPRNVSREKIKEISDRFTQASVQSAAVGHE